MLKKEEESLGREIQTENIKYQQAKQETLNCTNTVENLEHEIQIA